MFLSPARLALSLIFLCSTAHGQEGAESMLKVSAPEEDSFRPAYRVGLGAMQLQGEKGRSRMTLDGQYDFNPYLATFGSFVGPSTELRSSEDPFLQGGLKITPLRFGVFGHEIALSTSLGFTTMPTSYFADDGFDIRGNANTSLKAMYGIGLDVAITKSTRIGVYANQVQTANGPAQQNGVGLSYTF